MHTTSCKDLMSGLPGLMTLLFSNVFLCLVVMCLVKHNVN